MQFSKMLYLLSGYCLSYTIIRYPVIIKPKTGTKFVTYSPTKLSRSENNSEDKFEFLVV